MLSVWAVTKQITYCYLIAIKILVEASSKVLTALSMLESEVTVRKTCECEDTARSQDQSECDF